MNTENERGVLDGITKTERLAQDIQRHKQYSGVMSGKATEAVTEMARHWMS